VDRFTASGGISLKNPFVMQIYSDVLNMPVEVIRAEVGPALGSAIFAAVAAGCYKNIQAAAQAMKSETVAIYTPRAENARIYESLYHEYMVLYEYFGRAEQIMQRLRSGYNR
jgi:L-ribulokinase